MNCPHCSQPINIGSLLGVIKTPKKAAAARENGALGGRPRIYPKMSKRDSMRLSRLMKKDKITRAEAYAKILETK